MRVSLLIRLEEMQLLEETATEEEWIARAAKELIGGAESGLAVILKKQLCI